MATIQKYYIGYHNHPWDMKDFTILCETENKNVAFAVLAYYNSNPVAKDGYKCYEMRELPENAHY